MTEKRFSLRYIDEQHLSANLYDDKTFIGSTGIGAELIVELLNDLSEENEQLKYQNELLEEELLQCKAVIDNRWNEYLKKKELEE